MGLEKDLKVGVVGAGFIGPAHIEALRRLGIEVVGLCDATPELAAEKAKDLRLARAYASFDAMIADPALDVICTTVCFSCKRAE